MATPTPTTNLSDLSSRQIRLFFSSRPCVALKLWSIRVNVRSRSRSRQRPIIATVSFSLPTAKQPDKGSASSSSSSSASPAKIPKRVIKSFAMAELEARKLKYPTTRTEALLMGLLIEGTSTASKFLRVNGITLTKVREEALKIIPKGDMSFCSPEHPPRTDHAQWALDWDLEQKLKLADDGEITTSHLLLRIWSEVDSLGHKILVSLGFEDCRAEELRCLINGTQHDD